MGLLSKIRGRLQHSGTQADTSSPKSDWEIYDPFMPSLGQRLTNLLVDNGSSVNKQSIMALKAYIAERDEQIITSVLRKIGYATNDINRLDKRLKDDTGVTDLQPADQDTNKRSSKAQSASRTEEG